MCNRNKIGEYLTNFRSLRYRWKSKTKIADRKVVLEMAECSRILHRSASVTGRPAWARFAAIDHRSTDPREFQIAPFTLGFIVAHKSWSFLRANKTGDATLRNAAAGIIATHQATVANNFLLRRNSIVTSRRRSLSARIVLAAWLQFTSRDS